MAIIYSDVLFIFVLCLGCFVVGSDIPPEPEALPSESLIEENIRMNKHATRSDIVDTLTDICPSGFGCGFQIYNEATQEPSHPFIKYCSCPKDSHCVKVGVNVIQHFFYYGCKEVLEQRDVPMPTPFLTISELAVILESEELTSVLKDSTPGFVNPIYITSERTAGPSLDEITESPLDPGSYEEYKNPQNLEKHEIGSSDPNTDVSKPTHLSTTPEQFILDSDKSSVMQGTTPCIVNPINFTTESTIGPSLYEITEPSVAYESSNEESTRTQRSLEKDVENSDPRNTSFKTPINIGTESTVDPSLDKISESSLAYPGSYQESTSLPQIPEKNEVEGSDPVFKDSKNLDVIDCDINTGANIGRNCGAVEQSARDPDSKIFSSLVQDLAETNQVAENLHDANYYASEAGCSTNEEQNASVVNSFVAESCVDTAKATGADAVGVENVHSGEQSSLD